MLTGWGFFKLYKAIHLHFTSRTYDVIKHGGRTRYKEDSFYTRNDHARFEHFANKFHNKIKAGHFIIANMVYGNPDFVYGSYADAHYVYLQWVKIRDSITYEFKKDINYLNNILDKFDSKDNPLPIQSMILYEVIHHGINVETAIILNKEYRKLFDSWEEKHHNDPYMNEQILKYRKYSPFVSYDTDKIQSILKEANF